ncbi:phospholipase A2 inhibitor gamma subunit B-like isoform X1 [Centropristis striata]|uniref:phospholipase A2 inhibitor gamma subunit B-like isoform X1 n=1 Tax=Centropristis striata TaxID=184440 RepID=UPI0027E1307E|nr:phospholipase A2 inhibitor gamma subunit B-like isoform X1 [Centropristis striata]
MMKLILSLTLIGMLCSTAAALQCRDDATGGLKTCADGELCATIAVQVSVPGNFQTRFCAPSSLCNPNNQTYSFNFGSSNGTASVYCCSTNSCNSQDVPYPVPPVNKELKCYVCNNCNETVQCQGFEDRCLSGTAANGNTIHKVSGCVSRNLCKVSALPFPPSNLNFTQTPKCCDTSLCNSAGMFTLSAVPLLIGLILLVAF